jgi:hypothetical protein
MGDYFHMVSDNGGAHLAWAATFGGEQNVYYLRIDFPLTAVEHPHAEVPLSYALDQNYPNPFNPITTIEFALPREEFVSMSIFNLLGEKVATLVSEDRNAGHHAVTFDAANLPSGVYVYRISTSRFSQARFLLLLK